MRLMHTSLEVGLVKRELMHKIFEACMFRVSGSRTPEEGVEAQDLGGLHVPSGPITRAKAKQIQQAMESLLMGFLGQEESNSIGSPKGFIQLTCHEILKME
ncbi:hypothetical protein CDL15_Pgr009254 [Punica granatum]|uniref:Uncharacterized protein n=1 Tax=Punica granatum TaxID=22663 RepID=A0A218WW13_PUNGR|nr:hypothetical protein CDL15_Pgr009254 [Punica granatum]